MIAYFSGSGNILNELLGVPDWVGTLIFLIPAAGVAWFGLKAMGVGNKTDEHRNDRYAGGADCASMIAKMEIYQEFSKATGRMQFLIFQRCRIQLHRAVPGTRFGQGTVT